MNVLQRCALRSPGKEEVVVVGNWTEVPYSPMIELEILSKTEILGFKQLSSQAPSNDEMMKCSMSWGN